MRKGKHYEKYGELHAQNHADIYLKKSSIYLHAAGPYPGRTWRCWNGRFFLQYMSSLCFSKQKPTQTII